MSDNGSGGEGTPNNRAPAVKDRRCRFCDKAFTSSSLGRHYDQWIKDKNPKADDGIHDVNEIRKMRGNITRRQARTASRRRASTAINSPSGTPASGRASPNASENPSESASQARTSGHNPFQPGWESTGVINTLPTTNGDPEMGRSSHQNLTPSATPRLGVPSGRRAFSTRQDVRKTQHDLRQQCKEASNKSKAAELAIKELLLSLQAARLNIDIDASPFDFSPLALDFASLCTQCLEVPPTLFSSIPYASPSSWSIDAPDVKQLEALRRYFESEIQKWKRGSQITAQSNWDEISELDKARMRQSAQQDAQGPVDKVQKEISDFEKQVEDHVNRAWSDWESLDPNRKNELWLLEVCRAFGREKGKVDRLKKTIEVLNQDLRKKEQEIENYRRQQQPREFMAQPPAVIPIDRNMLVNVMDGVDDGHKSLGLGLADPNQDMNALAQSLIDRWAAVIHARTVTQKSLDPPTTVPSPVASRASQPFATPVTGHSDGSGKTALGNAASVGGTARPAKAAAPAVPAVPEGQSHAPGSHKPQSLSDQNQVTDPQHQTQRQSVQPSPISSLAKNPLPPYRRGGAQSRPLAPNHNGANYGSAPTPAQGAKTVAPSADMDLDDPSDRDADGDEEMEDERSFATMSTPLVAQPQHATLEVARSRPSQPGAAMQSQQQQQHPHPQQLQHHHQQAQRMLPSDHRTGQYITGNPRMPTGNTSSNSNPAMNPQMNMSNQMLSHGNVLGASGHMGMGMAEHDGMFR